MVRALPPGPPRHGRRTALVLLLGTCLLASGCFSRTQEPPPPRPVSFSHYVALGDTFAAAPYTSRTRKAHGCHRAVKNYPRQVAQLLDVAHLTDVSCAGASPSAATHRQRTSARRHVPPQLDAVTAHTDLVTISLGADAHDMLAALQRTCASRHTRCTLAPFEAKLSALTATVRNSLDEIVRAVQTRAPRATIVVVGYPTHISPDRGCRAMPKTTAGDRAAWKSFDESLSLQLSRAARDTGSAYADVLTASAGHGICSKHPWVQGRHTDKHWGHGGGGVAFGPTAAGQKAIARLVARAARDAARDSVA